MIVKPVAYETGLGEISSWQLRSKDMLCNTDLDFTGKLKVLKVANLISLQFHCKLCVSALFENNIW